MKYYVAFAENSIVGHPDHELEEKLRAEKLEEELQDAKVKREAHFVLPFWLVKVWLSGVFHYISLLANLIFDRRQPRAWRMFEVVPDRGWKPQE